MDNYVKGVKVIEIYDAANKELLVKYDDKHNIDKVISALNIKSWKETEKSIGMNPKYTIKFYCDTTNQDEEKDIKIPAPVKSSRSVSSYPARSGAFSFPESATAVLPTWKQ